MAGRWFRFDADFADHHKAIRISPAARWLFVASVGYCWRHETDGWVPAAVVRRLLDDPDADRDDERRLVDELLAVGLWERDADDYRVHDYLDHQPSSQQRTDERDGSRDRQRKSRERRAAQGNGVTPPPDGPGPQGARDPGDGHTDVTRDADDRHTSRHAPSQRKKTVEDVTVEDTTVEDAGGPGGNPSPDPHPDDAVGRQAADDDQPEAEVISLTDREAQRLCGLLADEIEAWSGERPPIGKQWMTAARGLLTRDGPNKDGYTAEQVEYLIRWATSDEFWRPNILSMPTLRKQRLKLIGQIQRDRDSGRGSGALDYIREQIALEQGGGP